MPFASGTEVVRAVLGGKAVAGIRGHANSANSLEMVGCARWVYCPSAGCLESRPFASRVWTSIGPTGAAYSRAKGVTAARQALIVEAVRAATMHESWQGTRPQNHWKTSRLFGSGCNSFIDFDLSTSRVMVPLLKLKPQAAGQR